MNHRKATPDEIQAAVQAAIMYYKEGRNQSEIADRMGITRQTVSKLLKIALQEDIVIFHVRNPLTPLPDESEQLKRCFGLKTAVVAPIKSREPDLIASTLAQYASEFLATLIEAGARRIGLSWGRTMYRLAQQTPSIHSADVTVFPLVGASQQTAPYFMLNEMVRRMADNLNGRPIYAYIPADPGSKQDAELFKRTAVYKEIKQCWQNMDVAILGIGMHPDLEKNVRDAYPGEHKPFNRQQAVGDLLTHYFDTDGVLLNSNSSEILCVDIEDLRATKRVLAVAGGREKTAAILGALRTGVLTDLVTDEECCKRLLRLGQ